MAENAKKTKATNKKNLLYALWVIALVAVMVTAIVVVTLKTNVGTSDMLENTNGAGGSTVEQPSNTGGELPDTPPASDAPSDDAPSNGQGNVPDAPVVSKVTFIMPCENSTVIKGFTADTVVFNSTLGAYMGHLGVDFSAEEGAPVRCVYDGVIESITTSYLTGTTITVDHGNNLKTVYNSIVANDALFEGAEVAQGDVLGSVSTTNLQEYKDGPHLHFEVIKSGEKVNPDDYLIGEEK